MKLLHSWLKHAVISLSLVFGSSSLMAFPEIPFCPLGGPPGWWNRMTDDDEHYHYYPPPRFYAPPQASPYWGQAYPYSYVPQSRLYPQPLYR